MNVKSVEKENGNATIIVTIEKELFDKGVNAAYQKSKKDIMVPGFRKGKAPRRVVEGMYGSGVFFEDGINEVFPEVYVEVIKEKELKAVGMPSVTDMDVQDDGSVELVIVTALYPEVTLGDYKGLEVTKAVAVVAEEEIDAELAKMAERNSRIESVERPAQNGDTVILDFEGFDNGVAFAGGQADNHSLKLGSNQFIPGFEEALIGVKAGEDKDVDITFPEEYAPELAGKAVVFKCKIHEVKETITPALDDEFAKDVSEFDTLAEVREDIRTRFTTTKEESSMQEFENNAVTKAANNMTCDIPGCMIDEQVDMHMEQFANQLKSSGMTMEDYAKMMGGDLAALRGNMRPMAEMTVKSNVLLSEIVTKEALEATDADVDAEYTKVAEQYQMEVEKVKELLSSESVKSDLATRLAVKLIVDSAVAVAPVVEEKTEEKAPAKKKATKKVADAQDASEGEEKAAPKKRAPKKKAEPKIEE